MIHYNIFKEMIQRIFHYLCEREKARRQKAFVRTLMRRQYMATEASLSLVKRVMN